MSLMLELWGADFKLFILVLLISKQIIKIIADLEQTDIGLNDSRAVRLERRTTVTVHDGFQHRTNATDLSIMLPPRCMVGVRSLID